MQTEESKFSSRFYVRKLSEKDAGEVYDLCRTNPVYYEHMKEEPSVQGIAADMSALPPGSRPENKFFVGYYEKEDLAGNASDSLIAVLDLIVAWPNEDTALIGWLMLHKSRQRKGIASRIAAELSEYLKARGFSRIRLGYVKGNEESRRFWEKNGFLPTGEESEREQYTVVVMQKELQKSLLQGFL